MKSSKGKGLSAKAGKINGFEATVLTEAVELQPQRSAKKTRVPGREVFNEIELATENTELRRAQEELELSRDRFAKLYDFAPVGYFTFDELGLIREVNLTGAQLLGVERRALVNKPFIGFIADVDGREVFSNHLEEVLQRQGVQKCAVDLAGKGGAVIHGQLQSVAVDAAETKDSYILCSLVDGTLGNELETEIQDAREYAENIVETLREPLVVLNSDLQILTANRCFYQSFKVTPKETIGNYIYDLGNRQWDIPKLRVLFEDILPNDTVINGYEVEHDFLHIGPRTILLNARQIFRKKIGSHIILLALQDITESKQLSEKLLESNNKLESTVRKRTDELTKTNVLLSQEVDERKSAEASLKGAYEEIKQLKDLLQAENVYLQQEVSRQDNFGELIGESGTLSNIFSQIEMVAPLNATVLLQGETGTGKGEVARAIHRSSTRKDRPMITVNCAALPASLIENELFGREKGAFTGSDARQIGRFELANHGTIFLDEIGEISLELQCKLLRVIQDGEFERLGSPHTVKTDVRIIAASNRDLEEEIGNGTFREDLFYRLNVFPIRVPSLRERKEDIPLLVNHFITKFNKKIGKKIETVSKATLDALEQYHWPGNVRELECVIERAVIISQGSALKVMDRFSSVRKKEEASTPELKALFLLEHDHILQVLKHTNWRIEGKAGAAAMLGLNASTLRARMRKYGITRH